MNTTTDPYFELYSEMCDTASAQAYALGYAQGSMQIHIATLEALLRTRGIRRAQLVEAIRKELRRLEATAQEIKDPTELHNKKAQG